MQCWPTAGFGAGAEKGHRIEGGMLAVGQCRRTNRAHAIGGSNSVRRGQSATGVPGVSATVVGQSTATTRVESSATQVSARTVEQTEERTAGEDALVMRVVDAAQSAATPPPQMGALAPGVRRTEGDAFMVSPGAVVIGQGPMLMTSALAGVEETALAERL